MTLLFNVIKGLPHGEERPREAGARLEPRTVPMQRSSAQAGSSPFIAQFAQFQKHRLWIGIVGQIGERLAQPTDHR